MENKNFKKCKEASEALMGVLSKMMTLDVIYEMDPDMLEMLKNTMDLYNAAFALLEDEINDRNKILQKLEKIESYMRDHKE